MDIEVVSLEGGGINNTCGTTSKEGKQPKDNTRQTVAKATVK